MKFKRQKDIPMTTNYPPPVVTNEPLGGRRTPLPPVSENGTLHTESMNSATYSRPPSVQNVPQFLFSSASTTPPLAGSTKIDMERIMKQDEAAMNDFVPPRQAMNSDESDFDWDEDINIDISAQVHRKKTKTKTSKWKKLSPFLRMVIITLIGCSIIALPAILVTRLMADDPSLPDPSDITTPHPAVPKATISLIFVWLSFMWGIVFLTNWGIDIVPAVVVRLSSILTSSHLENLKSQLLVRDVKLTDNLCDTWPGLSLTMNFISLPIPEQIFVATKKYFKFLLASCWSIGSFAFLSKSPYSRTDEMLNPIFIEVLGSLVAGCALVFIEKILLHMISTNFHQTAYADRIKESKYALSVLDRLSSSKKNVKKIRPTHSRHNTDTGDYNFPLSANRSPLPSRSNSLEANGTTNTCNAGFQTTNDGNNTVDGPGLDIEAEIQADVHGDAQKISEAMILNSTPITTPMETTNGNSRNSTLVSAERHRHHHRGQRPKHNENIFRGFNRRLYGIALANKSSPSKDIGSTENAKRLAKTLFYNLQTNSDQLVVQDFCPYFDTEEEAQVAFTLFDKDGNGDISKSEMKEKIFYVYKERKDLHTSLRDLSQAVGKLDIIFLTIVAVIWLLIVLSIFGKDIVKNMLSIGSFLVALSFVFGNSLKILFENIVFLFITHPYDSGDLVCIDGNDMYVREVGLNSTTFVTWDGKRMYFPNNIISQKPIHNVRRSPNMTDKILLSIDCYTPQVKILELRARMRDYLIKESKEFLPDLEIQIQEMDTKLKISMCIEHKGNWQDSGRRWARRTAFNYALKEAVEDIGIKYYALAQRVEVYHRDNQEIDGPQNRTGNDQETMIGSSSPLRQYPPEYIARLYRRPTISRPAEGGGGAE
ncbi:hypothetical protein BGZ65_004307 [Modicella reniformis]|uniref:EF-hand domain-containing protein n=1 Tax=Modicella reniformis TaxID=1440133 RepID=A0A9P6LU82_9FUNG|nr:hypothetical protein BGZ65_004307 [Modicella reniformis]